MARIEHHSAYAFLSYLFIYFIWKGTILTLPRYIVFLVVIAGMVPDFDTIYYLVKKKGKIDTDFQHHLYYWTHWPISYIPFIIVFVISLIFDFYPEYFLIPVVGIYLGHLIPDSISTGDGIMWAKIPWKKHRYARYINICADKTDGYHGRYWDVRYRHTLMFKLGTASVILSLGIITYFFISAIIAHYPEPGISGYYLAPLIYFGILLYSSLKPLPNAYYQEPPEGRYADYRVNPRYINGLSEKERQKHLKKWADLLEKNI